MNGRSSGGLVGVTMAGSIIERYPAKLITIVHMNDRLLDSLSEKLRLPIEIFFLQIIIRGHLKIVIFPRPYSHFPALKTHGLIPP